MAQGIKLCDLQKLGQHVTVVCLQVVKVERVEHPRASSQFASKRAGLIEQHSQSGKTFKMHAGEGIAAFYGMDTTVNTCVCTGTAGLNEKQMYFITSNGRCYLQGWNPSLQGRVGCMWSQTLLVALQAGLHGSTLLCLPATGMACGALCPLQSILSRL